ncbi:MULTISPECIES: lysozyme [Rahnella]|uniref:Lysozyme n=1 Tax=Rahnella laticis TaxID=2787622 RepID=A0ABS0EBG9_9GAMM|nr:MULTISPECIES: lysozyme [Rahnella]MBF7982191.1 lysozyme [Rahnella laticis]MBF8002281.1 lysozyme [Rahnella sp. LAC-M12]
MSEPRLSTGAKGVALIKTFEGLRLEKYQDVVGKWTIGYGHLILPDESFSAAIPEAQADALLRQDLGISEKAVNQYVIVPLTQNQFDALVSFTFNLGIGNLKSSTLLRVLNARQYQDAANEFLRWDKAGGKQVAGLIRRRTAERALFISQPE